MDGNRFINIVKEAFYPFLQSLGFSMDVPSISGKFYRVSFSNPTNQVSISYEPGDSYLALIIFSLDENGELSNIDDRSKTPRLSDLNSRYMHLVTSDERKHNETMFSAIHVADDEEMLLVKYAKELSLVLPKYLYG